MRLNRPHVRGGEFNLPTEKTGMVVVAPILPALAASIAAAATGELTFSAAERRRSFMKNYLGSITDGTGASSGAVVRGGLKRLGASD